MPAEDQEVRDVRVGASSDAPAPGTIVVTLVHGTILLARWPIVARAVEQVRSVFSRPGATPLWHQRGSPFATLLTEAMEGRGVIEPFDWAGGNTVWARLSAAGASREAPRGRPTLREHIATVDGRYFGAAQVLIAHSHGGNVCLAALRDEDTRKRVKAFVSLSTPYVHLRPRRDAQALDTALTILGAAIYLFLLFSIPAWLKPRVGEPWTWIIFSAVFMGVVALGSIYWDRRKERREAVRAWAESVNEAQEGGPARLVVTSDGDEALLVLKIAEALTGISRALWRAAYSIVELVERGVRALRSRMSLIYFVAAAAALEFFLLYDAASPWGPVPGVEWTFLFAVKVIGVSLVLPGFLYLLFALALFVPTLVAMLVGFPFLVFFRWLAFGWGGSPGVDITAESMPLGSVTAERLPAPEDARGLRHSELYNDPRVPPRIADFILRAVDGAASTSVRPQPRL